MSQNSYIKQCVVDLVDSDGNFIMAFVEYNTFYESDFVVTQAVVEIKATGGRHFIKNVEMIRAQYSDQIVNQIKKVADNGT